MFHKKNIRLAATASIVLVSSLSLSVAAQAQTITVINSGFELPTMTSVGDSSDNVLTGWFGNSSNSRTFGTYYVPASAFSSSPAAPDGKQIAYVNNGTSISQDTGVSLAANTSYTLTALIGRNNTSPNALGEALLFSGGSIVNGEVIGGSLLGISNPTLTTGKFSQAKIVFSTGALVTTSGSLVIQLKSLASAQVNFDSVSLFRTSAVPEPTGLGALAGTGMIASMLFSFARKRRK